MTTVSTNRYYSISAPRRVSDPLQDQINRELYQGMIRHIGQIVDIDNSGVSANSEFAVPHSLGVVPSHVQILVHEGQSNHYLSIRPGPTAWTRENVYLECNSSDANIRLRIVA